jgi:serine/threonine protein phosphatase PrpC
MNTITEQEIPVCQLQRMVLYDDDVLDILKRCFATQCGLGESSPTTKASAPQRILHISRVCGELAVSRALGDRDFKASFQAKTTCEGISNSMPRSPFISNSLMWKSSMCLPYPEDHDGTFVGDLVSNVPDFQTVRVGQDSVYDEFLLLACDGLWDVMDADDAYRVSRDLLFEKKWSAQKTAARLAELAVHLGSSDNITVIVVRFFREDNVG